MGGEIERWSNREKERQRGKGDENTERLRN
jgi:hypothetical protein